MARHKEQDILDRLIASLSFRGILLHPATLFVLATMVVIGTAIFLWERQHESIASREQFRLTAEKIQLTPPPVWAKDDLKELVIDNSVSVGVPSILDTQLVPRTVEAMRSVGFVERINRVQKSKSGLEIDLNYRHPVANVLLNKNTLLENWSDANRGKQVLLPVDRHGVVMPEKLNDQAYMPWIAILYPAEFANLTTWADWPDQRIQDAAAISAQFSQSGQALGVKLVMTVRTPDQFDEAEIPYELWPSTPAQVGTVIVWGNAPGREIEGEATAEQKLAAITAFVNQYGPLNNRSPRRRIDVRSGTATMAAEAKTASRLERFVSDLK